MFGGWPVQKNSSRVMRRYFNIECTVGSTKKWLIEKLFENPPIRIPIHLANRPATRVRSPSGNWAPRLPKFGQDTNYVTANVTGAMGGTGAVLRVVPQLPRQCPPDFSGGLMHLD